MILLCLGDSNTQSGWQEWQSWCERTAAICEMTPMNRGRGGSGIVPNDFYFGPWPLWAAPIVDEVLVSVVEPGTVVISYGTNDLSYGFSGPQIVRHLRREARRLRRAGWRVLIATIPPRQAPVPSATEWVNRRVRTMPHVEFFNGFGDADLVDPLHFTDAGQQRRAERAAEKVCP